MDLIGVASGLLAVFELAKHVVERMRERRRKDEDSNVLSRFARLESRIEEIRKLVAAEGGETPAMGEIAPRIEETLLEIDEIRREAEASAGGNERELAETILAATAQRADLRRWIEEARTEHLEANRDAPVAILYVVKGQANRRRMEVREGSQVTVGSSREDAALAFSDGAVPPVHCRLRAEGARVLLSTVAAEPKVRVGREEVSSAELDHADVVRLSNDSAFQVIFPSVRGAEGETARLLGVSEALEDSQAALAPQASCRGGCGRALGPDDVAAERAVAAHDAIWCLPCLVQGKGDFQAVDQYRILSRLGQGGMGEVHLAIDTRLGRLVAVKLLRDFAADDAEAIVRFSREAWTGGQLSHPNIVTFLGTGRVRGVHYIAMEYVRGKTVRKLLSEKGRLKLTLAVQVAYQVTKALAHARERDIVHRDIKPDNILLDRTKTVKVLDMGLAKRMATAGRSGVTAPGAAMGTLHYMAPEQIQDACFADHRADIYSLGVTLYEMATGARPIEGRSEAELVPRILSGKCPPISALLPDAPRRLGEIVSRAMALSPDDRYPEPGAMGSDLKELLRSLKG
ncbi:MAG: protein kinase [Planctomycetes bacterium]|nr:protein kinase [Planctomycetota bacterium]